jgi:beta-galactosidase
MDDFEKSAHINELPAKESIIVKIDYRQTGVGGDNSWDARTHREYTLLTDKPYTWQVRLTQVTGKKEIERVLHGTLSE